MLVRAYVDAAVNRTSSIFLHLDDPSDCTKCIVWAVYHSAKSSLKFNLSLTDRKEESHHRTLVGRPNGRLNAETTSPIIFRSISE